MKVVPIPLYDYYEGLGRRRTLARFGVNPDEVVHLRQKNNVEDRPGYLELSRTQTDK